MDHEDVNDAVTAMLRVLGPRTTDDWTVRAGTLEWTCWQTAAHVGHDLLAYAGQLAARPTDGYLPVAAMGVAETLLHTYDIARGLSVDWLPPAGPSAAVLDRLFPAAPPGDPARVLLWCTGRGDLDGLPRRTSWVWEAALPD
ncbi:hypothetical protein ACWGKO_02125 [Streptomyces griseoincarnatus]